MAGRIWTTVGVGALSGLAGVAAMTRGEAHHLATLREALEVQAVVEAILAAGPPRA